MKKGFTLIELLVVVLIIGILAAVALPQYQKAVIKSRFSMVMPIAKAIADAQEVYYLGNNAYALDTNELDVAQDLTENVTVTLSQTNGRNYVLAQHTNIPELHYIMYQQHSTQFPGEIHCEAKADNVQAEQLCKGLASAETVGQTLTRGYNTYLLRGTGMGTSAIVKGDVTGDGIVNADDYYATQECATGARTQDCEYADINGDGDINIWDVIGIADIIRGQK